MSQEKYLLPEKRSYAAAQHDRFTTDWRATWASEDTELSSDLTILRARSRQMIRDNPYAFNLMRIFQNNVVGTGMGIQCQVENTLGKLDTRVNDSIEQAWEEWCNKETCHTAGRLSFTDMLRLAIGAVFQDGEFLIRKIKKAFGGGNIPFALEVIESDLLVDEAFSKKVSGNGSMIRMGIEVDEWLRPVAYWLWAFHPGDTNFLMNPSNAAIRRIPAKEIEHLYIINRWPQTRGVPVMHAVLRSLRDLGGYTDSELIAARASANIVGFVKMDVDGVDIEKSAELRKKQMQFTTEPGTFRRLFDGESFEGFSPTRPNNNVDAFMRYMLRMVAAGVGVSYESLSRDYSQSNYSSSRLSLLDDRDQWRAIQAWMIRNFLMPIYREWLDAAVISGAVKIDPTRYFANKTRFQQVKFKPRGWSWVDPSKEVSAYTEAVKNGFMSRSDVVSSVGNGQDFEDVMKQTQKDRQIAEEYGFKPSTSTEGQQTNATPQTNNTQQQNNKGDTEPQQVGEANE